MFTFKKYSTLALTLIVVLMPVVSFAQALNIQAEQKKEDGGFWHGLVPCGREVYPQNDDKVMTGNTPSIAEEATKQVIEKNKAGTLKNPCTFNGLMDLVNNLVKFILFVVALPLTAVMIAYAGFLYLFSGISDQKSKAKGIFFNAVIGLVIAFCAFLIIQLILRTLGYDGSWIGF